MRLIVGEASLHDFDLATLVAEIERILNNRPLTDVSSEPKDFSALTPHMLLTGPLMMQRGRICSWKVTNIASLGAKHKHLPTNSGRDGCLNICLGLEPGALVLLCDSNTPRGCWPKALVEECFPDKSGLVRRVRVRTANTVLRRDVRKLCLLEGHLWCVSICLTFFLYRRSTCCSCNFVLRWNFLFSVVT